MDPASENTSDSKDVAYFFQTKQFTSYQVDVLQLNLISF